MIKNVLTAGAALALTSCASLDIDGANYTDVTPNFDLFTFFEGEVDVWGIVQNRSGNLIQRFDAEIIGTVDGDMLTLDETFNYGLGEGATERVWQISKQAQNAYTGSASDVLGTAQGRSYGNGFLWAYEIELPVGERQVKVNFQDWIWAFDEATIVNRSYIRKFGITFAEVTIFMRKRETDTE